MTSTTNNALRQIIKDLGITDFTITNGEGEKEPWKYDYHLDRPVRAHLMTEGSERWERSEKVRLEGIQRDVGV